MKETSSSSTAGRSQGAPPCRQTYSTHQAAWTTCPAGPGGGGNDLGPGAVSCVRVDLPDLAQPGQHGLVPQGGPDSGQEGGLAEPGPVRAPGVALPYGPGHVLLLVIGCGYTQEGRLVVDGLREAGQATVGHQ